MSTPRSLAAHALTFAATLAAASLFAEAAQLRDAAALADARALVAVTTPWVETVATDNGWSDAVSDELCDLFDHAHSVLRRVCPADPAIVVDAADAWDAAHPGSAAVEPAAAMIAARDRAADLLTREVSHSAGDSLRAERSPHRLLANLRTYDGIGLPGAVSDALGDLTRLCITAAYLPVAA